MAGSRNVNTQDKAFIVNPSSIYLSLNLIAKSASINNIKMAIQKVAVVGVSYLP
jgi:hypothetical protein